MNIKLSDRIRGALYSSMTRIDERGIPLIVQNHHYAIDLMLHFFSMYDGESMSLRTAELNRIVYPSREHAYTNYNALSNEWIADVFSAIGKEYIRRKSSGESI